MMRHRSLVVLAGFAILALLPAAAFAAGPFDCPDPATSFLGTPAPAAGGQGLFSPQNDPQNKVCFYLCDSWGFSTSMKRGTGSDCTAASNALQSAIGAEASSIGPGLCNNAGAAFGYCGFNRIVTVSCHWDFVLVTYVIDGYGDIKCKDYC